MSYDHEIVKLGQHAKLAHKLRQARGKKTKKHMAERIGVSPATYTKLEEMDKRFRGNVSFYSHHLARYFINEGKGFYE